MMVIEGNGNPHDHPMMRETFGWRTDCLDEAIRIARLALEP